MGAVKQQKPERRETGFYKEFPNDTAVWAAVEKVIWLESDCDEHQIVTFLNSKHGKTLAYSLKVFESDEPNLYSRVKMVVKMWADCRIRDKEHQLYGAKVGGNYLVEMIRVANTPRLQQILDSWKG